MRKVRKSYEDPYERKAKAIARMEFKQKREKQVDKYRVNDEIDDNHGSLFNGVSEFNFKEE